MRLLSISALLLAAALMTACGDDDGGASTTPTATETSDGASPVATATAEPTPTPTPALIVDGSITTGHPLVLAIVGSYISQIPPIGFTAPIACEEVNAEWDAASEEGRTAIDEANTGRLCILLSQSTFEEATATVFVGYYRSDAGEYLNMVNQNGAWVIASVTTQAPL